MRLTGRHVLAVAFAISVALAFIDLEWSTTLRYRVAQPDFFVYYLAAQIGRARGWAAMYDPSIFLPAVTAVVGRPLPYLNPPELAWLVLPLSWLPYALAGWIWTGVLAAAFAIAWSLAAPGPRSVRLVHGLVAATLLPVFVGFLFGQVSLIVVAAVVLCWWLIRRGRPWLAGVALAALSLKPQVAFLVPLALLAAGYWRVVLGWLAVTVPLALIALLAVGTSVFHQAAQSMAAVRGIPGPVQVSLERQLPLPVALIAIALVLGLAITIILRGRGSGPSIPIAVGLVSSTLVSPYVNFYDLSGLALAIWLVLGMSPPRWQQAVTHGMYAPLYLAPIWPLVTLAALCGWLLSLALHRRRLD